MDPVGDGALTFPRALFTTAGDQEAFRGEEEEEEEEEDRQRWQRSRGKGADRRLRSAWHQGDERTPL